MTKKLLKVYSSLIFKTKKNIKIFFGQKALEINFLIKEKNWKIKKKSF